MVSLEKTYNKLLKSKNRYFIFCNSLNEWIFRMKMTLKHIILYLRQKLLKYKNY
jgi:hypothetical protein